MKIQTSLRRPPPKQICKNVPNTVQGRPEFGKEMRETNLDWHQSLKNTLSSTGSAIVISVVVLLGSVIPLMNTSLANTWSISLYIAEALILDVLTALMFLPLVIYWLKPKYVFSPFK